jgi:CHASE3 domain sensor protein
LLALAVCAAFFASAAVFEYRSLRDSYEDSRRLRHAHQIESGLSGLFADLSDAESSVRGYVLTGEESYVSALEAKKSSVLSHFEEVRKLIVDPEQLERLAVLQPQLQRRLEMLEDRREVPRNEALRRRGG